MIESEDETVLREPDEVARRVLCLVSVAAAADGVDRTKIRAWLQREQLWEHCSLAEMDFLSRDDHDRLASIQFGWRSECVWVLLWALQLVDELAFPECECSVKALLERVPRFGEPTGDFTGKALLRPVAQILDASDLTYRAHWATRNRTLDPRTECGALNPDVVTERHWALNWLTRYCDGSWDDVTTDT